MANRATASSSSSQPSEQSAAVRQREINEDLDRFASHLHGTLRPDELLDIEYRFIVNKFFCDSFRTPQLEWAVVQQHYREFCSRLHLQPQHNCKLDNCSPFSLRSGTRITDPAGTYKGPPIAATGTLYVCTTSLRRHVCTNKEACDFTELMGGTSMVCTYTGRVKDCLIVSLLSTASKDQVGSTARLEAARAVELASHEKGGAASARSGPGSAAGQTKRGATPAQRQVKRSRPLFCSSPLARTAQVTTKLTTELRTYYALYFSPERGLAKAILDDVERCVRTTKKAAAAVPLHERTLARMLSVVSAEAGLTAGRACAMRHFVRNVTRVKPADLDYLARAAAWILAFIGSSPKLCSNDNAVSARGARGGELCISILKLLRDGVVGVRYREERITRREAGDGPAEDASDEDDYEGLLDSDDSSCADTAGLTVKLMTQAEFDANIVLQTTRYDTVHTFVPAHQGLAAVLPSSFPDTINEDLGPLVRNMMKHDRSCSVAFLSVLSAPNTDPTEFCLRTYMAPRPELLNYLTAP